MRTFTKLVGLALLSGWAIVATAGPSGAAGKGGGGKTIPATQPATQPTTQATTKPTTKPKIQITESPEVAISRERNKQKHNFANWITGPSKEDQSLGKRDNLKGMTLDAALKKADDMGIPVESATHIATEPNGVELYDIKFTDNYAGCRGVGFRVDPKTNKIINY